MTQPLEEELKNLLIEVLGLEDIQVCDIDSQMPLFGEGLGLDSVDALELGLALQKRYNITIDPQTDSMREHFANIVNLANFVRSQGNGLPCD